MTLIAQRRCEGVKLMCRVVLKGAKVKLELPGSIAEGRQLSFKIPLTFATTIITKNSGFHNRMSCGSPLVKIDKEGSFYFKKKSNIIVLRTISFVL